MNNKQLILKSLLHALAVIAYIAVVVLIMQFGEDIFGSNNNQIWAPIGVLLLFTVSAAITGALVLGRPAYLFFNGQKTEAVKFLLYTIAWLFFMTLLYLLGLAVF